MKVNNILEITKEELVPLAEKMLKEKRRLIIMNGYINKDGDNVVVYNFDVDGQIKTYLCKGDKKFPSITPIYKGSAQWCEEEMCEMMGLKFEGLEKFNRLFLPDEFDGTGQILVMPLDELKKKNSTE